MQAFSICVTKIYAVEIISLLTFYYLYIYIYAFFILSEFRINNKKKEDDDSSPPKETVLFAFFYCFIHSQTFKCTSLAFCTIALKLYDLAQTFRIFFHKLHTIAGFFFCPG